MIRPDNTHTNSYFVTHTCMYLSLGHRDCRWTTSRNLGHSLQTHVKLNYGIKQHVRGKQIWSVNGGGLGIEVCVQCTKINAVLAIS